MQKVTLYAIFFATSPMYVPDLHLLVTEPGEVIAATENYHYLIGARFEFVLESLAREHKDVHVTRGFEMGMEANPE